MDDEPILLEYFAEVLQKEGYRVTKAMNARQALRCLHRQVPDLIITDYMMPEMDGVALIAELRNDHRYSNLPVILMSAVPPDSCGADVILHKDHNSVDFLDAVSQLVSVAPS